MQQKLKKTKVFPEILLATLQILLALGIGCLFVLMSIFQIFSTLGSAGRSPGAWLFAGICFSGLLLFSGVRTLSLASRFHKVVTVQKKSGDLISLEELSRATSCPVEKLGRELQIMIGRGYFTIPAQLDLYKNELVVGNAVILPPVPNPSDPYEYKEVSKRSPSYFIPALVVAAAYAALLPLTDWITNLIFVALVAGTAAFSRSRAVPIRRLVHTKRKAVKSPPVRTGDKTTDEALSEARNTFNELHYLTQTITGTSMDIALEKIRTTGSDILAHVEQTPEKLRQIRQFLNYYLPTTVKLLRTYEEFRSQPVKGENINRSMQKIENMMQDIAAAFHKELDNLYFDRAVDVSADIDVMQSMLRQEGIHQGEVLTVDFNLDK